MKLKSGVAGAAIATALIGGSYAAKQLTEGSASTAFSVRQGVGIKGVPFLGPFAASPKHGSVCGPAVRLMEGALRRTTPPVRTTPARNCVGAATTRQLKRFQARHKIAQTGIYGLRTHRALAHAYSRRQRLDLGYLEAKRLDALHRQTILVVTSHAYVHRAVMGYCDYGHLSVCNLRGSWPQWPDVPRHADCSSYVQWVFYQSGLPSPNGTSYPGNTKSLVLRGARVPVNGPLKVGDLVFYSYNNSHVAIYIGHGLVSSHGQPGIGIRAYAYRPIYAIRRYFG